MLNINFALFLSVPTSAPQSIEAFALDSRTLNIQWNAPPPEFHNGIILDYYVNVSTIETGEVFQVAAGGSSSVTIPGLHPFYTYVYITAAATSVGRGPFSVANSIQMPEDGTCDCYLSLYFQVLA